MYCVVVFVFVLEIGIMYCVFCIYICIVYCVFVFRACNLSAMSCLLLHLHLSTLILPASDLTKNKENSRKMHPEEFARRTISATISK